MTISLVMHCLNEAEFIGDSLRSVLPFVDEAIVIDQGSTDGTLDILKRFPSVHVIQTTDTFLTHGEKYFRDLAVYICFSDWLMIIDADEIMSPGWNSITRAFLGQHGHSIGMVMVDYYQMIGSSDFHTPDSPLPNHRPFLVRMHVGLKGSESLNGTQCHSSYRPFISPDVVAQLPTSVACFHMGYAKTDMTARFARNIERGDFSGAAPEPLLHTAKTDPLSLLPPCIPRQVDPALIPNCLRKSKWKCDYDPVTRRIKSRTPVLA